MKLHVVNLALVFTHIHDKLLFIGLFPFIVVLMYWQHFYREYFLSGIGVISFLV